MFNPSSSSAIFSLESTDTWSTSTKTHNVQKVGSADVHVKQFTIKKFTETQCIAMFPNYFSIQSMQCQPTMTIQRPDNVLVRPAGVAQSRNSQLTDLNKFTLESLLNEEFQKRNPYVLRFTQNAHTDTSDLFGRRVQVEISKGSADMNSCAAYASILAEPCSTPKRRYIECFCQTDKVYTDSENQTVKEQLRENDSGRYRKCLKLIQLRKQKNTKIKNNKENVKKEVQTYVKKEVKMNDKKDAEKDNVECAVSESEPEEKDHVDDETESDDEYDLVSDENTDEEQEEDDDDDDKKRRRKKKCCK